MDEQFHEWGKIKWLWLAALVLSESVSLAAAARHGSAWMALLLGTAVLALFLLMFGVYYLWRRGRARSRRQVFSAAIQAQSTIAPRSVHDPNQRAALDRLRQKFQAGLNEFTSRGRDIYKLPWYLIIGEPGSGKTEAIRHSGIDFPPGLQNELQGSGGTVNMDWWFSNHGVMLDTAGRLLFSESPAGQSPEWAEFLKLLKKARSHCPVNGLFIVLSVESLIRDSAEKIAQKASRMAQQLDLIQRTLDVRFPVYLLVSKCDLLTGFRDFFESIDDPLLQHQILGWSNPDPLDTPFRAELIDEHLRSVVQRISRRRLWLLRETFARRLGNVHAGFRTSYALGLAEPTHRRAEDAEALFALPESMQRLAPRLRRYLEKIFVSGEWSAKPVFLRGIFFTSSMRDGKALDEAIAFATGLPLEQLPEDAGWEKERAFFLRDLFLEKVFREAGLVTPSTNTLKLLRSHWMSFYGASALGLGLLLAFVGWGYQGLNASARRQADYWKYAKENWDTLSPEILGPPNKQFQFRYNGDELVDCRVPLLDRKPTLIEFHRLLQRDAAQPSSTFWLFKPLAWLGVTSGRDRQAAQRALLAQWILRPIVYQTRVKLREGASLLGNAPGAADRQRNALSALKQLEADGLARKSSKGIKLDYDSAERYLKAFLSFLVGKDFPPDRNLVEVVARTFAGDDGVTAWPPEELLAGGTPSGNSSPKKGFDNREAAAQRSQPGLLNGLSTLGLATAQ